MSIASSGTLDITVDTTTTSYVEQQRLGTKAVYSDASRSLGNPRTIEISHQVINAGKSTERIRTMVKLATKEENPTVEGDRVSGSIHVVLDYPTRIFEAETLEDIYAQILAFLSMSGVLGKLVNREV